MSPLLESLHLLWCFKYPRDEAAINHSLIHLSPLISRRAFPSFYLQHGSSRWADHEGCYMGDLRVHVLESEPCGGTTGHRRFSIDGIQCPARPDHFCRPIQKARELHDHTVCHWFGSARQQQVGVHLHQERDLQVRLFTGLMSSTLVICLEVPFGQNHDP